MVKESYRASLIYLVDDETNIRNLLSSLSHEEFAFRLLKMGIVFMGPFLVKNPDLLILDIMMPWTDGLSILEKIREVNKLIPVILLTARDSDEASVDQNAQLEALTKKAEAIYQKHGITQRPLTNYYNQSAIPAD